MFDITQIITAAVGLLAAVLTAAVIPWIKARVGAQRTEQLQRIAGIAVRAAEQMIKGDGLGDAKLVYATDMVRRTLEQYGVTYDAVMVRAVIEAAVAEL